jgi:hypothetical protein
MWASKLRYGALKSSGIHSVGTPPEVPWVAHDSAGLRYSPTALCWQRFITGDSIGVSAYQAGEAALRHR